MKIKFELKGKEEVKIINEEDGRVIGRVFIPSETMKDKPNVIQICGFSRAFELWGCGVIGDNNGVPTQDIQLLFKDFKSNTGKDNMEGLSFGAKNILIMDKRGCDRCFNKRDSLGNCKCSELKVFRKYKDIEKYENRRKKYEEKRKILKNLE